MVSTLTSHRTGNRLAARFRAVRETTEALVRPLAPEDTVVQSMPDVSPTKWHLAHVTWFFEEFVLAHVEPDYRRYDARYDFLFNSYYYTVGQMHARPRRGLLTRPSLDEVLQFRAHVDGMVLDLLERQPDNTDLASRIELGLNHEQQHQELLLTDIKHVLFQNPLQPAYDSQLPRADKVTAPEFRFEAGAAGIQPVGYAGAEFHFDNETPRHDALLYPHAIASRLVTNAEYRDFIKSGGYADPALWLADGWSTIRENGWQRPLYWSEDLESEYTLGGERDIDWYAPVAHISYYEADAFARWAGARLPTEFEWESRAATLPVDGNLLNAGHLQPVPSTKPQLYGDAWEWTSSPYAPYPGFQPLDGSLGEYNGKFMCNQVTVRGGSAVTSQDHVRATYRSFFYPHQRWQMLGLRLAKDGAP
jgi:ergothioneine biosynthesis protein EgtB